MFRLLRLLVGLLYRCFCSRKDLLLENLALRQQLSVFKRSKQRPNLAALDRLFWIGMNRMWTEWKSSLLIVFCKTTARVYTKGFTFFAKYSSWSRGDSKRCSDYLRVRAFRRFAGALFRLLVTGFLVLAASNRCRMPCSNSSTALSRAPSCPTRTIATDMCKSNDGGRNTSTVSREMFPAIKCAGSSPTP